MRNFFRTVSVCHPKGVKKMTATHVSLLAAFLLIGILSSACGGDSKTSVDSYVALAPRVLRSGEAETVSLTVFSGSRLASSDVSVTLSKDGETVAQGSARVEGKGTVGLDVPVDASGEYELAVSGNGFTETATVQVQDGTLLFIESDKPVYKPGQTVMMRVATLNSELMPLSVPVTVEISDAKGNKVFKQAVTSDQYGMASLDLPLSNEPNLGVWKIAAQAGDTRTELDVRVEEYVLPKYEVAVELSKTWFLVDEPISGGLTATYSFGKSVNGEAKISATRYVGVWEEFATVTVPVVDGQADFEIAAAGYVAGVAEAGGNGNVQLDIMVEERNTGYAEETSELVTVAAAPLTIQIIPESPAFKPGLPYTFLVVTETPDGQPVDAVVSLDTSFGDENYNIVSDEHSTVSTARGVATATLTPPADASRMWVSAATGNAYGYKEVAAAYSPSGNFIHVSQLPPTELSVGTEARFHVESTSEARAFYYEVVSRDRVVFTAYTETPDFAFEITPQMAGASKLLVYQVLPTSEVAADFIPFEVEAIYPHDVSATFNEEESQPGEQVTVDIQTQGPAKVGLAAVDRSVFILAENRLNLDQVFAEIERLYQEPQAELHDAEFFFSGPTLIPGASDTFANAGMLVLTNKKVPEGKDLTQGFFDDDGALLPFAAPEAASADSFGGVGGIGGDGGLPATGYALAEVQRVRQFFPETWIWDEVVTDDDGAASMSFESPDTITTWDLRAIAISPEHGLGVVEAEHKVFQPFFVSGDLPYSAIRGEEFPLKVALYNYTDSDQEFLVEVESADWFELLETPDKTVTVAANDTGGTEFMIRATGIGTQTVKITARSTTSADAVIESIIIDPEGVQREFVDSGVLVPGSSKTIDLSQPSDVVPDSERAYVAITGSLLTQTIQGLDQLLQMPYGCGEQNMLLFAPDAYILDYLRDSRQLTPEIRAKAETLLVTGYQRELTYRRADGSFSAFGDQDPEGSMFLTAFVLRTFAQASDLIYIDETVQAEAASWIATHQNADGSFQDVGFVHHSELLGGIQGQDALTAYAAIAMLEAGQDSSAERAIEFLTGRLAEIDEPYSLALVAYALELADSPSATDAYDKLIAAASEDDDGLHWSGGGPPQPFAEDGFAPFPGQASGSSDIEATGYATLALIEHGDALNAGRAAKWLAAHRNSLGGFGSTQDTVVALQALTQYAASAGSDTDMTVTVRAGDTVEEVRVTPANFDLLQLVEVPAGVPVILEGAGEGQAVYQVVQRFNVPEAEDPENSIFDITVDYDTTAVSVNDRIQLDVSVGFNPIEPVAAGMVVLDVAVPTGFAPATDTLDGLLANPKIKRYDIAGRKVILYIEDMAAGETIQLSFEAIAQYPVKSQGVTSQAYSYYTPEWRGETMSEAVIVE
jgi:CD109 antigen